MRADECIHPRGISEHTIPQNSLTRFSHHEVATKYRHDPVLILLALWVFV